MEQMKQKDSDFKNFFMYFPERSPTQVKEKHHNLVCCLMDQYRKYRVCVRCTIQNWSQNKNFENNSRALMIRNEPAAIDFAAVLHDQSENTVQPI